MLVYQLLNTISMKKSTKTIVFPLMKIIQNKYIIQKEPAI
jgi:hypothetical protein